jgi:hypothetical protein
MILVIKIHIGYYRVDWEFMEKRFKIPVMNSLNDYEENYNKKE